MTDKIKMADVFDELPLQVVRHPEDGDEYTPDFCYRIEWQAGDICGIEKETAEAICHAVNNHDALTAKLDRAIEALRPFVAAYKAYQIKKIPEATFENAQETLTDLLKD